MPSEEEETYLRRWRDLLRTELTIAFEELSPSREDAADKRLQHYVECCAEQYWTFIARITATIGEKGADRIPPDSDDQRNARMSSIRTFAKCPTESAN
jgi:hypothetical protein